MEKRLLFAVLLSMIVVFTFQSVFAPKKTDTLGMTQDIGNQQLAPTSESSFGAEIPQSATGATSSASEHISFNEQTFTDDANGFAVTFTNKGGNIQDLKLSKFGYDALVRKFANFKEFENSAFEYEKISSTKYLLSYTGNGYEVSKKYNFSQEFLITVDVDIKNISETAKTLSPSAEIINVDLFRLDKNSFGSDWTLLEYSIKSDKKILRKDNANKFNEKWNKEEPLKVEWMGFRDRYFASVVKANKELQKYTVTAKGENELALGGSFPTETIHPGETKNFQFQIYLGPQDLKLLSQASAGFDQIMVFSNWGWLDAISKAIYWLLATIHGVVPSWGLCIILISLIVYGAMYPLTLKSLVSMKKMQAVQPQMAELKKKYAKNPEKMNQEVMELYKRNGVNPLSGCLPMLLQMPIFVGLYQVLWRSFYFRGEGFLWIKDLSMPDRLFKLPFTIPFLGEYFNILPIIMAAIMFFQQKMNMSNIATMEPEQQMQQKMMAYFMPVFLGFIFYNFGSGLNVYFVVFYALSGYSQWHVARNMKAVV